MAKRETHNEDCLRLLGKKYDEVNAFLDSYAAKYPPPLFLEYHRKFLHNAKGVQYCKEKFGFYGEIAAKIHLIRDLEIYVLKKPFDFVEIEEIDELYEQALKYCHDWQGPLDDRWLKNYNPT